MSSKHADIEDEVAHLRREVHELKALLGQGGTTKAQRQALRKHVEELDEAIKKKATEEKPVPEKVNTFQVGQTVDIDRLTNPPEKSRGKIQYIACRLALPKFKHLEKEDRCDRRTCTHKSRPYVWVMWPDQSVFAYHFGKLKLLTEEDLKPRIGRELSGRIGPWVYDIKTEIWKRDGDPKNYTREEFADFMYYEANPYAKEEAAFFLKSIMNMGRPISRKDWPADKAVPAHGEHEEFLSIDDEDIIEMK